MTGIRLLTASSLDTSPTQEVSSQSISLVPSPRFLPANRTTSSNGSVHSGDDYVWSVSVGDDGSFNFYSAPRQSSAYNNSTSSQGDDFVAGSKSGFYWNQQQMRNVAAQYAFYASAPASASGSLINVYA